MNIPTPGGRYRNQLSANPRHTVSNPLGLSGGGWEHNQFLAIKAILDHAKTVPNDQKIEIKVAGYSRGGTTATSFTRILSQKMQEPEYASLQGRLSIAHVQLVDPVAGSDYGKYAQSMRRKKTIEGIESIDPTRIGRLSQKLTLHIATQEKRRAFKPQLPVGLDPHFENNRPLLIPDRVEAKIRLSHACHQTIAYPEFLQEDKAFTAGKNTYNELTGKDYKSQKESDWRDCADSGTAQFLPNQARNTRLETSENEQKGTYQNSVLYDYYQIYCREYGDKASFYDALTNPKNPHYETATWAYYNSTFYTETKFKPAKVDKKVLAQAIACQSKNIINQLAFIYSHNEQNNSQYKANFYIYIDKDHTSLRNENNEAAEEQRAYQPLRTDSEQPDRYYKAYLKSELFKFKDKKEKNSAPSNSEAPQKNLSTRKEQLQAINDINLKLLTETLTVKQRDQLNLVIDLIGHAQTQKVNKYKQCAENIIKKEIPTGLHHKVEMLYRIEQQCLKLEKKMRSLDRRNHTAAKSIVKDIVDSVRTSINQYKQSGNVNNIKQVINSVKKNISKKDLTEHRGTKKILYSMLKPLRMLGLYKNSLTTDSVKKSKALLQQIKNMESAEDKADKPRVSPT